MDRARSPSRRTIPKTVYHGAQRALPHHATAARRWTAISPDLTRNDKTKQKWSRRPDHRRQHRRRDLRHDLRHRRVAEAEGPASGPAATTAWSTSRATTARPGRTSPPTMPGLPGVGHGQHASSRRRFDAGTAYVVVDAHRLDDMRPYLWKTTDFGKTWKRLDGGLPRDVYLHVVREDPKQQGHALPRHRARRRRSRRDDGATWRSLKLNLPTVAVHDLQVKDDTSSSAPTAGRSGSSTTCALRARPGSLRQRDRRQGRTSSPRPDAVRWAVRAAASATASRGDNPPRGAVFYYWLKDEPKGDVTLEILDAEGKVVATLSSKAARAHRQQRVRRGGEGAARRRSLLPKKAGRAARRLGPHLGRRRDDPRRHARLGLPGRRPAGGARHLHRCG